MYFDVKASGERIKALRKEHGITQEELANKIGVTSNYLSKMESGCYGGSIDVLIMLSDCFDVSLDYIVLGRTPPSKSVKVQLHSAIEVLAKIEKNIPWDLE